MIRDKKLKDVETHIYYWDNEQLLFPRLDLYPNTDVFPTGVEELSNVSSGSMKLDEMIADSELRFGTLCASKFEVVVYNMPEDLSGKYIQAYQIDEGKYKGIFSGKIVSCKQDNTGLDRTIVAYDSAYVLRERDVSDWWLSFWEEHGTATVKQVRESLLQSVNVEWNDNRLLPNDNITVRKNVNVNYIAFGTVLSMLCELNGCFPHFNRDNVMEFITLGDWGHRYLTVNNSGKTEPLYEGLNSSFEEYTTDKITGVEFYDSEGELKYMVGDLANTYKLSSNIFCYDMGTFQLKQVGKALLDKIKNITYTPASVKMIVGDLDYCLGMQISTQKGSFYILENQFSGAQLVEQTMIARGEQTLGEGSRRLTDEMIILNEKWSRLTFNVETFKTEFGDYQKEVSSMFEQTAESIKTEVSRGTRDMHATYQGDYIPTASNYPANEWKDENERAKNVGATFYNTKEGRVYRWTECPNAIALTWDTNLDLYGNDYVDIFCMIDGKMRWTTPEAYNRGKPAGKTVLIPNSELYVIFTAGATRNKYGFSIASIHAGYELDPKSDFDMDSEATSLFNRVVAKAKEQGNYTELNGIASKPESDHNPYNAGTYVWKWSTGIGVSASGSKYGWVPQEGFAYSQIEQTADKIRMEITERKFSEDGIREDYNSKIEQTSSKIDMKVSKGDVSSQLSLEPDKISLKGNRLIVDSTNFKLSADGTLTTNNAIIKGDFETGSGSDRIEIKNRYIRNPATGNYFDMNGQGYGGSGIHANTNVFVLSTSNIGVTEYRGSGTVWTGRSGWITLASGEGLHFIHGLLVN